MRNQGERGITLVSLVCTVAIIIVLAGMGISAGSSNIQAAKYTAYQTELKVLQIKINKITEQYQEENKQIGVELRDSDKQILNTAEVVEQLAKKAKDAGITLEEVQNGFRLCTPEDIKQTLGIENITREFLINVQQCIVISTEKFQYEGTDYYMQEQMKDGLYNVTYKDQISKAGNFEIATSKKGEKYEIAVTPIHSKYVSKWQIKYKLQESIYWKITNNLTFTVDKPGTYEIQVVHKDEIDLGTKTVTIEP